MSIIRFYKQVIIDKLSKSSESSKEKDLVRRFKNGDENAFGILYMNYLDQIYRYIFFRVNQDKNIAEDLTENVFEKAWRNRDSFKRKDNYFKAWLYTVSHNTVIDYYRTSKSNVSLTDEFEIPDGQPSHEELFDKKEIQDRVKKALSRIPAEQRNIITLRYIEGLPSKEVAAITGKSDDAVRAMQSRALKKLKKIVGDISY